MRHNITLSFKQIAETNALSARLEAMLNGRSRIHARILDGRLTIEAETDPFGSRPRYFIKLSVSVPGAQIHADNRYAPPAFRKNLHLGARSVIRNAKSQLIELRERRSEMGHRAA
jgi:hypothetical protein